MEDFDAGAHADSITEYAVAVLHHLDSPDRWDASFDGLEVTPAKRCRTLPEALGMAVAEAEAEAERTSPEDPIDWRPSGGEPKNKKTRTKGGKGKNASTKTEEELDTLRALVWEKMRAEDMQGPGLLVQELAEHDTRKNTIAKTTLYNFLGTAKSPPKSPHKLSDVCYTRLHRWATDTHGFDPAVDGETPACTDREDQGVPGWVQPDRGHLDARSQTMIWNLYCYLVHGSLVYVPEGPADEEFCALGEAVQRERKRTIVARVMGVSERTVQRVITEGLQNSGDMQPFSDPQRRVARSLAEQLTTLDAPLLLELRTYISDCNAKDENVTVPMMERHLKTKDMLEYTEWQIRHHLKVAGFSYGSGEGRRVHINKERKENVAYRHKFLKNTSDLFDPQTHLPLSVICVSDESYCNLNHSRRQTWSPKKGLIAERTGAGARWNIIGMAAYYVEWGKVQKCCSQGVACPKGSSRHSIVNGQMWAKSDFEGAEHWSVVETSPTTKSATRKVRHATVLKSAKRNTDDIKESMAKWTAAWAEIQYDRGYTCPESHNTWLQMQWVKPPEEGENSGPRMWQTEKNKEGKRMMLADYHLNVDCAYYERWLVACMKKAGGQFAHLLQHGVMPSSEYHPPLVGMPHAFQYARRETDGNLVDGHAPTDDEPGESPTVSLHTRPITHLIDNAASHVRVAERMPTKGGWCAKHDYLRKLGVDPDLYAHLKPKSQPNGTKNSGKWGTGTDYWGDKCGKESWNTVRQEWVPGWIKGGDRTNPGKNPPGWTGAWAYGPDLDRVMRENKPEYVREVVKLARELGQRIEFTPAYHPGARAHL